MCLNVINEDGTPVDFEYPKNPLEEKWTKLYPPIPMPQYSQVCDEYSCMWCDRCPKGSNWTVPDEDKEVWDQYQEQIREYNRIHNPSLYNTILKIKYNLNADMPDPCPECGRITVKEFYNGLSCSNNNVESYTYFCKSCGLIIKKEVNISTGEVKYEKIKFDEGH